MTNMINRRKFITKTLSASSLIVLAPLSVSLGGCGFHLRGKRQYPFKRIFLITPGDNTFSNELRRQLEAGELVIVKQANEADIVLEVQLEQSNKEVLSIDSGGRVREYSLHYKLIFSVTLPTGTSLLGGTELNQQRTFTYNDNIALAKQNEEILLLRNMQTDVIQQLLRRLSLLNLPTSHKQNADPSL